MDDVITFFINLFSGDGFMRRWDCGRWTEFHGWLYVISDIGVWSAYTAIPAVLIYFVWKKTTIPFRRIFWLFGAFILACGLTHLFDALMFWWPAYRFLGLLEFGTAIVSWATVIALIPIIPQALALRSPQELQREVDARRAAEVELQCVNRELERRINERTAELVEANATLHRERERFQTTLESIGDAVIATDIKGQITFVNRVAESLTGWSHADALFHPLDSIFKILNEQTRQPAENPALRALNEGAIVGLANHTVLISKSGQEIPIDDSAAPIRDESGAVVGVVLVFRDVTQRQRMERSRKYLADASTALATSTDQLATLQMLARLSIPYPADWCVIYLLQDNQIIERAAVAHIDLGKEMLLNKLQEKFPVRWHSAAPSAAVIRTGQPDLTPVVNETYLRNIATNDEHYDLLRRLSPRSHVFVPLVVRKKVVGAIGFIISESDHQYTHADLGIAEDLARRAAVALENVGLYQDLREADRRKDEFLAMLAHELRNPLAPIRNALELLQISNDAETTKWAQQVMLRQVEHIVRLVDDLLDVSRIMRGKIQLKTKPVELGVVINHAIDEIKPDIKDEAQRFTLSLPPERIWLQADPTRLSQIIFNLLNNAVKYTDRGGEIALTVEVDGSHVVITFRDTGIGIPPEMLKQIFVPFTQVSHSLDRSRGGLGIGLALVRSLVEMHGGTVTAHSDGVDTGSQFVVRLPILKDYREHDPTEWKPSSVPAKRILVVDDNHEAAQSLVKVLTLIWKHEVEVVYDGLTALEKIPEFKPQVVLLDIGLPGLSGYEIAEKIRQLPGGKAIKLVALTGYGQEGDRKKSLDAGFDLHLVKPASLEALQEVLGNRDAPKK